MRNALPHVKKCTGAWSVRRSKSCAAHHPDGRCRTRRAGGWRLNHRYIRLAVLKTLSDTDFNRLAAVAVLGSLRISASQGCGLTSRFGPSHIRLHFVHQQSLRTAALAVQGTS